MATAAEIHARLVQLERSVFLPIVLLINFGIFQYLVLLFHSKARRQPYLCLLLATSAVSVIVLVPFASQSAATTGAMNDVSESCLALMLLVLADLLILFDCLAVALGIVGIFSPRKLVEFGGADEVNNNAEVLTLAYTFVYRFGTLALLKGSVMAMLREDALEMVAHVVFAMHEYPFMIVFNATGVNCEPVQILFMRLALVPCVWITIGEHHYRHPTVSQLSKLPVPVLQDLIQRASIAAELLDYAERSVILPLAMLINFGIFQYLVVLYHQEVRRQPYVCLLLVTSAISFIVFVPYATLDRGTLYVMNDVSESCLALMLLVQTTFALKNPGVIGYSPRNSGTPLKVSSPGSSRSPPSKQQLPSTQPREGYRLAVVVLRVLKALADVLILFDGISVVLGVMKVFSPDTLSTFGSADEINMHSEFLTLAYTFVYRFGVLALQRGSVLSMLREDGFEVAAHVFLVLHELPLVIVEKVTGSSWGPIQTILMRLALVPCVWMTIGEHHYRHPTQSQLSRMPRPMLQELIQRASVVAREKKIPRRLSNCMYLRPIVLSLDRGSGDPTTPPPSTPSPTKEASHQSRG